MRRRAAINPEPSWAPKRLVHLAGSDSEEGMEIDSASYKMQPSYQTLLLLNCIFMFSTLKHYSGGVSRFQRLLNVITMYKWLRKLSVQWVNVYRFFCSHDAFLLVSDECLQLIDCLCLSSYEESLKLALKDSRLRVGLSPDLKSAEYTEQYQKN